MSAKCLLNSVVRISYTYLSSVQLLGSHEGALWQTGLLTEAVRKAGQHAELSAKHHSASDEDANTARWIVLDGELNPAWIDGVNCLLNEPYTYSALNGDVTTLHG